MLGIEIDKYINWKPYIQKLWKHQFSLLKLHNLKKKLKTALSAYYVFSHSRLTYGIILWRNCRGYQYISVIQKKCIWILSNIGQMISCKPYFKKLKILTITCLHIFEACKFVNKYINLYSPIKLIRHNNGYRNKLKLNFSDLKLYLCAPRVMLLKK